MFFLLNLSNHRTEHFKYPSAYQWEQFPVATTIHNYWYYSQLLVIFYLHPITPFTC